MFGRSKKPLEQIIKKQVDVNVKENNASWILNEELKRMHERLSREMMAGGSNNNIQIWWAKIQELQKVMVDYVNRSQDPDVKKSIADIQNHLVDSVLLDEEKK